MRWFYLPSDLVVLRVELMLVEKRGKVEGESLWKILKFVKWLCLNLYMLKCIITKL